MNLAVPVRSECLLVQESFEAHFASVIRRVFVCAGMAVLVPPFLNFLAFLPPDIRR